MGEKEGGGGKNIKFLQTKQSAPPEIKLAPPSFRCALLFTESSPLVRYFFSLSFLWMNELGAIKKEAVAGTGASVPSAQPLLLATRFPEESLWTISGCRARVNQEDGVGGGEGVGGVDYAAHGNAPLFGTQSITRTISCPPSNQPTNSTGTRAPTRSAVPARLPGPRRVPPRPLNQKLCADCASQCVCLDSTINIKQQLRGRTLL